MASNELNPHPHPQSGPGAHALALRQSHALQTEVLAARQGQDGGDDDEILVERVIGRCGQQPPQTVREDVGALRAVDVKGHRRTR